MEYDPTKKAYATSGGIGGETERMNMMSASAPATAPYLYGWRCGGIELRSFVEPYEVEYIDFTIPESAFGEVLPLSVKQRLFSMYDPRVLVTGALGLFGSHLVRYIVDNTNWQIVALCRGGKVGSFDRLFDDQTIGHAYKDGRIEIVWHDLRDPFTPLAHQKIGAVDYVIHAAAETHVDRSITDPDDFVRSNVLGTMNLLNYLRDSQPDLKMLNYFSTDEVYGPAYDGVLHGEDYPIRPTNPYAASKAGAEALIYAWGNTYKVPAFVTNTMNLFGRRQHPEKFIPKIMQYVLEGKTLKIHSDPTATRPGSRFYLHCDNAAAASVFLLANGKAQERYNVVGEREVDNLELAQLVAQYIREYTGTDYELKYELVDFHSSRPGHDLRYALDGSKLSNMGFSYPASFEQSLRHVVNWTLENRKWLDG